LHKQSDQSANGAEYESQGQARSASPLEKDNQPVRALKGRNLFGYFGLSGLDIVWSVVPGATRCALAPGFHIPRRWRSAAGIFTPASERDCFL